MGIGHADCDPLLRGRQNSRSPEKGNLWLIPADAARPADKGKGASRRRLKNRFPLILTKSSPPPQSPCQAITRTQFWMPSPKKDFIFSMRACWPTCGANSSVRRPVSAKRRGDDAARLRACPVAIAAAISMGDYQAYTEIDSYLKKCVEAHEGSSIAAFAELALATAAVSMIAPQMAPGWLQEGNFSALAPQAKPDALYLRAK